MNNRKFCFLVATLCMSVFYTATAQSKFDVHVGFSPAQKISSQEIRVISLKGQCNGAFSPTQQSTGLTIGMGVTHALKSGFFMRAEMQYYTAKTHYEMREILPSSERVSNLTYYQSNHTITLPLSVGVQLGSFRVTSGVNANAVVHSTSTLTNLRNFKDSSSAMYLGWHAGLGYDIGSFGLEIRYSQDFGNYGQGYSIGDRELTYYGNRLKWTFLAKYYFG